MRLPNTTNITTHFETHKGRHEPIGCSMGMASVFYDVLNHVVIDSSIENTHKSERELASCHLSFAKQNDLIIYDRRYTAFWLYAFHLQHNYNFCMRTKINQMKQIKAFIKSNKKEAIITLIPNRSSIKTCQEKSLSTAPIKLRLIRVDLPNETEVLIPHLMDKKAYPATVSKSLYH